MSKRPSKYKQYLERGESPPKSTKYDHANRKRQLSSSSSSTDDMEEFYSFKKVRKSKEEFSPILNEEPSNTLPSSSRDTDVTAISQLLRERSSANNVLHKISTARDEELEMEDFEKPVPMDIRLGSSTVNDSNINCSMKNYADDDEDDSDAEMDFWKKSMEGGLSKLEAKLKNGDLDEVIPAKLVVSQAEMLSAIQEYVEHFSLPNIGFEFLCKLFNSFMSTPVLPDTRYHIDNLLRCENNVQFHAVCPDCKIYLRSFNSTERTVFCEKCKNDVPVKGNNVNYFVLFDIEDKVKHSLEKNDQYYAKLLREQNNVRENLQSICDGLKYKEFYSSLSDEYKDSYVTCTFNTDGAPVWKSANYSIWPIQLILNETPDVDETITAAMWLGKVKPDMNIYMKTFAKRINVINENGIVCKIDNGLRTIRLYPICCCVDAVARAPLQGIVQFNGYYGCNWCPHPGVPVKHDKKKVIKYPLLDYVPEHRSLYETLKQMKEVSEQENSVSRDHYGIKGISPLIHFSHCDIIDGIVPDDLHCDALGVSPLMQHGWLDKSGKPYSLKSKIEYIDKILLKIQTPMQIMRLPRCLSDRKNWQGREHENWILYLSLPIFSSIPDFKVYEEHWQYFVESMHILKSSSINQSDLARASKCLKEFVAGTEEHYGQSFMTYTIHQQLHLVESVVNWGPLIFHTGYYFESGNGKILKMINSTKGVLHQICRKLEFQKSGLLLKQHVLERNEYSPVLGFIDRLNSRITEKTIKFGEHRYVGNSFFTGTKWIDLLKLDENHTKSFPKMIKADCVFASCKKEDSRSNNSFAQTNSGNFIKINEFIFDKVNEKEYTICNNIQTENTFKHCSKIHKIVKIEEEESYISTNELAAIAVNVNTPAGQYISAVPNMVHY